MADVFEVGEIAIGADSIMLAKRRGMECVILEPLVYGLTECAYTGIPLGPHWTHKVRWSDGDIRWMNPEKLRKRKPPAGPNREAMGEWDLCPWKPGLPQTVV